MLRATVYLGSISQQDLRRIQRAVFLCQGPWSCQASLCSKKPPKAFGHKSLHIENLITDHRGTIAGDCLCKLIIRQGDSYRAFDQVMGSPHLLFSVWQDWKVHISVFSRSALFMCFIQLQFQIKQINAPYKYTFISSSHWTKHKGMAFDDLTGVWDFLFLLSFSLS